MRTKDMERREKERKAIRMAEEEYKQLASLNKEISDHVKQCICKCAVSERKYLICTTVEA